MLVMSKNNVLIQLIQFFVLHYEILQHHRNIKDHKKAGE